MHLEPDPVPTLLKRGRITVTIMRGVALNTLAYALLLLSAQIRIEGARTVPLMATTVGLLAVPGFLWFMAQELLRAVVAAEGAVPPPEPGKPQ